MGSKFELVRGNTSGINGKALKDGQVLFDKEKKTIALDAMVNGTLTRINMSGENVFCGTSDEWDELTDAQKATYKYVYLTDDYEVISKRMTGATASANGAMGLVPQPLAGDQDKVLKGDGTWGTVSIPDVSTKMDKSNPTGTGSFSLNRKANTTVGTNSFAEGYNTEASGNCSHAEGNSTWATNSNSHAEGGGTTASGNYSHAEGRMAIASGYASHAEGDSTQAGYDYQHVSGKYNSNKSTTLLEIGNGASVAARSNAFEVYSDGSLSTDNGTTKVKLEDVALKSVYDPNGDIATAGGIADYVNNAIDTAIASALTALNQD